MTNIWPTEFGSSCLNPGRSLSVMNEKMLAEELSYGDYTWFRL